MIQTKRCTVAKVNRLIVDPMFQRQQLEGTMEGGNRHGGEKRKSSEGLSGAINSHRPYP